MLPYSFPAAQTYSPLSVISAVKIITLSLLVCGQDEQVSGMDQLYTGSGEDDTVQLSTTCLLTFTNTVWFCSNSNSGGPTRTGKNEHNVQYQLCTQLIGCFLFQLANDSYICTTFEVKCIILRHLRGM